MAHRVLEVTLQSAKDLKNVNLLTRMEVYAVATISGDPLTRQSTPPDPYGGRHPSWNATLRFAVPPTAASATGCLYVLLRTERAFGDRDVGEVIVPLADLLGGTSPRDPGPRPPQSACYRVRKVHRAETRGVLHLSYRLGPVVAPQQMAARRVPADEPVVAGYPVARPFHPQPAYAYLPALPLPPSPRASGSGHASMPPPPKSYGHFSMPPPPQSSGHVAMPPPTPEETVASSATPSAWTANRNESADFGMGFSAGLVGGAITGMMAAGDVLSDAAAYNAGYRAGLTAKWGNAVH